MEGLSLNNNFASQYNNPNYFKQNKNNQFIELKTPNITQLNFQSPEEEHIIQIVKQATSSIVHIEVLHGEKKNKTKQNPALFESKKTIPTGTGSGVILSNQGIIITNFHVIKNNKEAFIKFADGSLQKAKVLGISPEFDLAVLKVQKLPKTAKAIPMADSSKINLGQSVIAIGSPLGLNHTVTKGIISALNRTIPHPNGEVYTDLIQTDAAINPGNSGGALIDLHGKLIGINTLKLMGSDGIGFAIPTNKIKAILDELLTYGKTLKPETGLVLQEMAVGIAIVDVKKDSPAFKAGINPPKFQFKQSPFGIYENVDITTVSFIKTINGIKINSAAQAYDIIRSSPPNTSIEIELEIGINTGNIKKYKVTPVRK